LTDNVAAITGERLSNAVLDNIYSRRSVRSFTDGEVPDEIIKEIIRAGTYAPTAMNAQPWRFVVVKNKKLIGEYDGRARKLSIAKFKDTTVSRAGRARTVPVQSCGSAVPWGARPNPGVRYPLCRRFVLLIERI